MEADILGRLFAELFEAELLEAETFCKAFCRAFGGRAFCRAFRGRAFWMSYLEAELFAEAFGGRAFGKAFCSAFRGRAFGGRGL